MAGIVGDVGADLTTQLAHGLVVGTITAEPGAGEASGTERQ